MIQVYTGKGKGKTTAALGQALRALGQKKKVLLIQFLKKGKNFGELKALRRFNNFRVRQFGRKGWTDKNNCQLKDRQLAQAGWMTVQRALAGRKYDLVILDELNVALSFGLIALSQTKVVLGAIPKNLEVVITGRDAPAEITKLADLVSEIKELKHYYRRGISAREGIEF